MSEETREELEFPIKNPYLNIKKETPKSEKKYPKKKTEKSKNPKLEFPVRAFNGKLQKIEPTLVDGNYFQLLTVKEGARIQQIVFPFTQTAPYEIGEERIWTVLEKSKNVVSYVIAQPDTMDKKQSSILKKFWGEAISCKITLDYDGKGNTIEWEKKKFVPYEKKVERVKYYEIINESLDLTFFTTQKTEEI